MNEDKFEDDDFLLDEGLDPLEELLQQIESRWAELGAVLTALSEEEACRPDLVGSWSAKDVMAHIAAWEREGARRMDEIVHGNGAALSWPDRAGEDAFNASAVAASRTRTRDEVLKGMTEAHQDFVDLLAAFGEEVMTTELEVPAVEWIPGWTYLHYQEHAPQIRALRTPTGRGGTSSGS